MKKIIAGVDEVGRGSLIGPVYAAAVILNKNINKKELRDSKKLNKTKREILAKYINWWKEKFNLSEYGILWISFIKGLIIGLLIYHFFII